VAVAAVGVLHPQLLHLLALDDVVPVVAATMGLRLSEPARGIKGTLWDEQLDLIPQRLGLGVETIEGLFERLARASEGLSKRPHGLVGAVEAIRQHFLSVLLERRSRGD